MARLTFTHLSQYRALMLEAYAQEPDAFTSTAEERASEPDAWWARRLEDPSGLTAAFGAFAGSDLVGTIALEFTAKPKARHKAHLIGMYVRPDARGRGLARQLVDEAVAFAAARSTTKVITLTVTQGNSAAEALYRSCGFTVFGIEPMAIAGSSGYLSKVHMWRSLSGPVPEAQATAASPEAPRRIAANPQRWASGAAGRSHTVAWNGLVWAVSNARDLRAGFEAQVRETLGLLDDFLQQAGSSRECLLSVQVMLADIGTRETFNLMWCEWIGVNPALWPQRAIFGAGLAPGLLLEVVATAYRSPQSQA